MAEFRFKEKREILTVTINGRDYQFDCSPTNYDFVKRVAALSREVEDISRKYNEMPKNNLDELEKAFDFIREKEQAVIELIIPGKWDELFKEAGSDLLEMVDLIAFVAKEITKHGAQARRQAVTPDVPQDAEAV